MVAVFEMCREQFRDVNPTLVPLHVRKWQVTGDGVYDTVSDRTHKWQVTDDAVCDGVE